MTHTLDWTIEVRTASDPNAKRQGAGYSFAEFSRDVRIEYTFAPGESAVLYGDNSQPADPDEIEIEEIWTLPATLIGKRCGDPVKADHLTEEIVYEEFSRLHALYDAMVEGARTDMKDRMHGGADAARDAARDRRMEETICR